MKSTKDQKSQRLIKTKKDVPVFTIGSPKHSDLRLNKENDRYGEITFINKKDKAFDLSKKSSRFLEINSPKGTTNKPKMFSETNTPMSRQNLMGVENKDEKKQKKEEMPLKFRRKIEFDDIRNKITELEFKLDSIKGQYNKKPETATQDDGTEKRSKLMISKSKSVEKLATLKPRI